MASYNVAAAALVHTDRIKFTLKLEQHYSTLLLSMLSLQPYSVLL